MLSTVDRLTAPEEVGRLQAVAARLLMERHKRTGAPGDLDRAAKLAWSALARMPRGAPGQPDIANTAGLVNWLRYKATGSLNDLDRAVAAFEEAAEGIPADAPQQSGIIGNLAEALFERATREGSVSDLTRAVSSYRTLVQQTPGDSAELPQRLAELAVSLATMHQFTAATESLDEAIKALQTATMITAPGSLASVMTLNNLGQAFRSLHDRTQDPATLDQAIAVLERAVAEADDEGPWRAWPATALGSALLERYTRTLRPADLNRGLRLLTESVARSPKGSPDVDASRRALAVALARAADADHEGRTRSLASKAYQDAAAGAATAESRVRISDEWGRWAASVGAWQDAASAYRAELDAWESAVRSGDADRASFPGDAVATLPARAAYALATSADLDGAVLALERGRLLQVPRRAGAQQALLPTRAEVAEAAGSASIAYLLVTEHGGLALVVSGTAGATAQGVWLPEVSEATLRRQVVPYLSESGQERTLDQLTNWLWFAVMGPLLAAVPPARRLILIPLGMFALLPLHAAWRWEDGAATGRRYAIDESTITYAPSIRVLLNARRRVGKTSLESILAVTNPGSTSEMLPGAAGEGEMVSLWFPRHKMLTGMAATRSAVLDAIGQHDVVHFACHGTSDLKNPDLDALMMADNDALHPPDILRKDVGPTRLVVLSASETGVPGAEPGKEVLGWPGSFLAAGAAGVIASLWGVPDATSALLMARFYHLWHEDGSDPADALRAAQRWLRDSTNADKADFFKQDNIPFPKQPPATAIRLWEEGRSDASPTRWAGFAYFGA
jgi:CHAT domain-containing protein